VSKVEAKKKAGLIAIFKDLNAHLLNSLSYLTDKTETLPGNFIDDVMRPLIRNMSDIKD